MDLIDYTTSSVFTFVFNAYFRLNRVMKGCPAWLVIRPHRNRAPRRGRNRRHFKKKT